MHIATHINIKITINSSWKY